MRADDPSLEQPAAAPMLFALGRTHAHVYAGTVPAAVVARRRAANRVARASRRANRRSRRS